MKLFSRFSRTPRPSHSTMLVCVLPCLFAFATANAQSHPEILDGIVEDPEGREITRDAAELADLIRPQPVDPDSVDTVFVITNLKNRMAKMVCMARDHNGEPVGRVWIKVPGLGLNFIRASDLSDGKDYVGHAECKGEGYLRVSGFLVGSDVTDVPVDQSHGQLEPMPLLADTKATDQIVPPRPVPVTTIARIPVVASF